MEKMLVLSVIYFIGLLVLLVTGLCTFNWIYIVALLLGVVGLGYSLYRKMTLK